MGFQIHNDIVQLNNMLYSLKAGKDKLDENQIESLAVKIFDKIQEIDAQAKSGALPLNKPQQESLAHLLKKAETELSGCKTQTKKICDVRSQIFQVQKTLETAPVQEKLKVVNPKIELKISFFCDIDTTDHNGFVARKVINSIEQECPFITTRSVLMGSSIATDKSISNDSCSSQIQNLLFENHDKWEIFQQHDASGEEFLVFLPKTVKPDKTGAEKLQALDLAADGSLTAVSVSEVYASPPKPGNNNINAFFRLFTPNPKIAKLVDFVGHGSGTGIVGGLSPENYRKFLDFLEVQKCKGLIVSSCYAGGINTFQNIPDAQGDPARFEEKQKDRNFSVVVRSIGDFVAVGGQAAEQNLKGFYDEFAAFAESPQGQTVSKFRQFLNRVEGDLSNSKFFANFVQVYFPHSAGIPSGFQLVGEGQNHLDLTYAQLKQLEIQYGLESPIQIENFSLLELHPSVINNTLRFTQYDPYLFSMIPGNSHHVIKSIELAKNTPMEYISKFKTLYEGKELSAKKGYFIGTIENDGTHGKPREKFEEVVVYAGDFGSDVIFQCLYRKGDEYFWTDGQTTKKISILQHAIKTAALARITKPADRALRASSAGQESDLNFYEGLERNFWVTDDWRRDLIFPDKIPTTEELKLMLSNASKEDKESLVFHLMSLSQNTLAFDIVRSEKLDANMKDINGIPLIFYAITHRDKKFLEYLIVNGAEVNTKFYGSSVLEQAVKTGDPEIVRLLLLVPDIDLDVQNVNKNTPMIYAVTKPEIFEQLLNRGASVNNINKYQMTLLTNFYEPSDISLEDLKLLNFKADPNLGNPSALVEAVRSNNMEAIRWFLEYKGKPFGKDTGGNVPFLEALAKGTPEMVKLFLERKDCDLTVADNNGITPVIAALYSGNNEKMQMLKGARSSFSRFFE